MQNEQRGMPLLEVLLAMLVVSIGLFAAAALQLKALQATDGTRRDGQAAFAAHSEHERKQS